jgi:hypothetical protein
MFGFLKKKNEFEEGKKLIESKCACLNAFKFIKVSENQIEDKIVQQYDVELFNYNSWYAFDFLDYASKCYDTYVVQVYDDDNGDLSNVYVNKDEKFDADYYKKIVQSENNLRVSLTIKFIDGRGFSLVLVEGTKLLAVTNTDSTGVDLNEIIKTLETNYENYTESEFLYALLNNGDKTNIILLSGAYCLVKRMLALDDKKFSDFYSKNLAWMKKNVSAVEPSRFYWENVFKSVVLHLSKLV